MTYPPTWACPGWSTVSTKWNVFVALNLSWASLSRVAAPGVLVPPQAARVRRAASASAARARGPRGIGGAAGGKRLKNVPCMSFVLLGPSLPHQPYQSANTDNQRNAAIITTMQGRVNAGVVSDTFRFFRRCGRFLARPVAQQP